MNKNEFLICLICIIVIIYIIDKYYLKSNENFNAISDNTSGTIGKTSNISDTSNISNSDSKLLDLLKSRIENEIEQITKSEEKKIKSETKSETKSENISEIISMSNSGTLAIIIIVIIILICGCSSCIISIFTPSIQRYSYQSLPFQHQVLQQRRSVY